MMQGLSGHYAWALLSYDPGVLDPRAPSAREPPTTARTRKASRISGSLGWRTIAKPHVYLMWGSPTSPVLSHTVHRGTGTEFFIFNPKHLFMSASGELYRRTPFTGPLASTPVGISLATPQPWGGDRVSSPPCPGLRLASHPSLDGSQVHLAPGILKSHEREHPEWSGGHPGLQELVSARPLRVFSCSQPAGSVALVRWGASCCSWR